MLFVHDVHGQRVFRHKGCLISTQSRVAAAALDGGLTAASEIRGQDHIAPAGQFHGPGVVGVTLVGAAMIDYDAGGGLFCGRGLGDVNQSADFCTVLAYQL